MIFVAFSDLFLSGNVHVPIVKTLRLLRRILKSLALSHGEQKPHGCISGQTVLVSKKGYVQLVKQSQE
ncbi:MAG: hypothetical protein EZS28_039147 [Streblomastix strix]|uniref:Protein kinase domain-containing protein n=1 Tax=Streblomastix strix TaxID=222440 RepID=A0A5J4U3Z2_9EUKA|nr:MAG: hypothetical protein EZS28_039147 [Streblomastix strix]